MESYSVHCAACAGFVCKQTDLKFTGYGVVLHRRVDVLFDKCVVEEENGGKRLFRCFNGHVIGWRLLGKSGSYIGPFSAADVLDECGVIVVFYMDKFSGRPGNDVRVRYGVSLYEFVWGKVANVVKERNVGSEGEGVVLLGRGVGKRLRFLNGAHVETMRKRLEVSRKSVGRRRFLSAVVGTVGVTGGKKRKRKRVSEKLKKKKRVNAMEIQTPKSLKKRKVVENEGVDGRFGEGESAQREVTPLDESRGLAEIDDLQGQAEPMLTEEIEEFPVVTEAVQREEQIIAEEPMQGLTEIDHIQQTEAEVPEELQQMEEVVVPIVEFPGKVAEEPRQDVYEIDQMENAAEPMITELVEGEEVREATPVAESRVVGEIEIEREPEISEIEPEITQVEPEISEIEPEITQVEPEISDIEPESSAVEPEVSAIVPEISAVEPEFEPESVQQGPVMEEPMQIEEFLEETPFEHMEISGEVARVEQSEMEQQTSQLQTEEGDVYFSSLENYIDLSEEESHKAQQTPLVNGFGISASSDQETPLFVDETLPLAEVQEEIEQEIVTSQPELVDLPLTPPEEEEEQVVMEQRTTPTRSLENRVLLQQAETPTTDQTTIQEDPWQVLMQEILKDVSLPDRQKLARYLQTPSIYLLMETDAALFYKKEFNDYATVASRSLHYIHSFQLKLNSLNLRAPLYRSNLAMHLTDNRLLTALKFTFDLAQGAVFDAYSKQTSFDYFSIQISTPTEIFQTLLDIALLDLTTEQWATQNNIMDLVVKEHAALASQVTVFTDPNYFHSLSSLLLSEISSETLFEYATQCHGYFK